MPAGEFSSFFIFTILDYYNILVDIIQFRLEQGRNSVCHIDWEAIDF